jgi:hypothetical protein
LGDFSEENVKNVHVILQFESEYIKAPNVKYNTLTEELDIVVGIKRIISNNITSVGTIGLKLGVDNKFTPFKVI